MLSRGRKRRGKIDDGSIAFRIKNNCWENAKLEAVLAHQGLKTLEVFFLKKITLGNALQISKKSMQFYPRLYGGIR